MTKTELYEIVAKEAGIPKTAAMKAVNAMLKAIRNTTLKEGGEVVIPDLGKFYASTLPARKIIIPDAKNPSRQIVIKAGPLKVIRFRPYKAAKRVVRG